ncbi:GGDEF domain-containing protein [Marinimicrobium sp. ABcell2]|uniref:GGDEF domain-containing protein n=1 Tax=Marinimicrobium sp. ABcell2 TaxID=3069751 RepID=UPI0027AF6BFD|nr:GGDEF domain-containing protein [Marinimicrobium sp. ABcell2]MDQ2077062.1 GGDEF domain-containing protein [Marinimicrobium sp. ABcell2]
MKANSANLALMGAVLLTMVALLVPEYLPKRTWQLVPDEYAWLSIYGDELEGGPSHSEWIDDQPLHWRCRIEEQGTYVYCGFNVLTSENNRDGVDLSAYDEIRLKVRQLTEPRNLRLYMRNFDERYSTLEDANSPQYLNFNIRAQDLGQELVIHLNELTVADWWLAERNIPRDLARPTFSNIVAIGLDYGDYLPPGTYDLVIEKIEVAGDWVSTEHWYLGIIIVWLMGIFGVVTLRLVQLSQATRRDRRRLHALASQHRELKQEANRYKQMSAHDALTGAYNRYGFEKAVSELLADETRSEASLILLDIDHFKRINDTRGHNAGDEIITRFAKLITEHTRDQDLLCRWGGEEFLLLCPNTTVDKAFDLAEKIRKMIFNTQFSPEAPLLVTASFGVSEIGRGEEFLAALGRADRALYRAKDLGRNCTLMAEL